MSNKKGVSYTNMVEYKPGILGNALVLSTEQNTFEPAIPEIGGYYTVSFWIKPDANSSEELFKSQGTVITATANQIAYKRDGSRYQGGGLFPVA